MTTEQLAQIAVNDRVRLREKQGRVSRLAGTWFMITWTDDDVEIVRRTPSILTERLVLEPRT